MSYLLLTLVLNFIVGLVGFVFLVQLNAPADNEYHVVWGSAAFWAILSGLAYATTGWSALGAGILGGAIVFFAIEPGDVLFTWGRAVISTANSKAILKLTPLSAVLRFVGVRLKNTRWPFNHGFMRSLWSLFDR